ncbi:MAG: type 4a pilus biogenesis protein PilO [Peptococcaceae bacterium]|jgi:Tfp pilus assembly protein PilO|nr:type 4a pilus biogenesis protein PilO [Peptococcaceae bacterium]
MGYSLNKRERVFLTGLAIVVVLALGVKFLGIPLAGSYAATAAKLRAGQLKLREARVKASSLVGQDGRTESAKEGYDAAGTRFAAGLQDGGMLVRLGMTAQADGVRITSWQPRAVIDRKTYLEIPVTVELTGPYDGFTAFLNDLESNLIEPNLVDIRQIKLRAQAAGGSAGGAAAATGSIAGSTTSRPAAGGIDAKLVLVFYSSTHPTVHLAGPEIGAWSNGRPDPFLPPGMVSPYPGVEPQGAPPAGNTAGRSRSQGSPALSSLPSSSSGSGTGPQAQASAFQVRKFSPARLAAWLSRLLPSNGTKSESQQYVGIWAS